LLLVEKRRIESNNKLRNFPSSQKRRSKAGEEEAGKEFYSLPSKLKPRNEQQQEQHFIETQHPHQNIDNKKRSLA